MIILWSIWDSVTYVSFEDKKLTRRRNKVSLAFSKSLATSVISIYCVGFRSALMLMKILRRYEWVQCCRCSRWFHCSCVSIKLEDAKENDFFCRWSVPWYMNIWMYKFFVIMKPYFIHTRISHESSDISKETFLRRIQMLQSLAWA